MILTSLPTLQLLLPTPTLFITNNVSSIFRHSNLSLTSDNNDEI